MLRDCQLYIEKLNNSETCRKLMKNIYDLLTVLIIESKIVFYHVLQTYKISLMYIPDITSELKPNIHAGNKNMPLSFFLGNGTI